MVNEFRLSWARGVSDGTQDPFGNSACPVRLQGRAGRSAHRRRRGRHRHRRAASRIGSPNFMPKFQHTDQLQYLNTLSWLSGRHQWKFGADIMPMMNNEYVDIPSTRGNLSSTATFTGNAVGRLHARLCERCGAVECARGESAPLGHAFFVQDDWRAESTAHADARTALRLHDAVVEADNAMANFDPTTATLVFASAMAPSRTGPS